MFAEPRTVKSQAPIGRELKRLLLPEHGVRTNGSCPKSRLRFSRPADFPLARVGVHPGGGGPIHGFQ